MFLSDPLNTDNYSYVQLTQVNLFLRVLDSDYSFEAFFNKIFNTFKVPDYVYPSLGPGLVTVSGDRSPSSQSTVPGSNTTTHSLLQRRDSGKY